MATVIDSLLVTLGIDSSKFTAGQKQAVDALKKTENQSASMSKAMDKHANAMAGAFNKAKREILSIGIALVGISAMKSFIMGTVDSASALDRQSAALNMSAQRLAEWRLAAEAAGDIGVDVTAVFSKLSLEAFEYKNGRPPPASFIEMARFGHAPSPGESPDQILAKKAMILAEQSAKGNLGPAAQLIDAPMKFLLAKGLLGVGAALRAKSKTAAAQAEAAPGAEKLRQDFNEIANRLELVALKVFTKLEPLISEFAKWMQSPELEKNLLRLVDVLGGLVDLLRSVLTTLGFIKGEPVPPAEQARRTAEETKKKSELATKSGKQYISLGTGALDYVDGNVMPTVPQNIKNKDLFSAKMLPKDPRTSSEINLNGPITITTNATDAAGLAKALPIQLQYTCMNQANAMGR